METYSEEYKTNKHALYANVEYATEDQILNAFISFRNELHKTFPSEYDFTLEQPKINLVKSNNVSVGYAYIWEFSETIFDILTDENYTKYMKEIPNPLYGMSIMKDIPFEDKEEYYTKVLLEKDSMELNLSKEDIIEMNLDNNEELWEGRLEFIDKLRNTLKKTIKESFTFPKIKYTDEQIKKTIDFLKDKSTPKRYLYNKTNNDIKAAIKHYCPDDSIPYETRKSIAIEKSNEEFNTIEEDRKKLLGEFYVPFPLSWDKVIKISNDEAKSLLPDNYPGKKDVSIIIEKTKVHKHEGEIINKCVCHNVPKWVDKNIIFKEFRIFNTFTGVSVNPKNPTEKIPYPIIEEEYNKFNKKVIVRFYEKGNYAYDGLFAIKYNKKIFVDIPKQFQKRDETKKILVFSIVGSIQEKESIEYLKNNRFNRDIWINKTKR
jgi:hypothetical protein